MPRVPKSAQKCPECPRVPRVPKSAQKVPRVPKSAHKCPKMSKVKESAQSCRTSKILWSSFFSTPCRFSMFSTRYNKRKAYTRDMTSSWKLCWNKWSLPGFSLEISFSWKFGGVEAYNTRKVHFTPKLSQKLFSAFVAFTATHLVTCFSFVYLADVSLLVQGTNSIWNKLPTLGINRWRKESVLSF